MRITLLAIFFLAMNCLFAQQEYYSVKKGYILPAEEYNALLKTLSDQGKIETTLFKEERKADSIIHHVRLTLIPKSAQRDPYASVKKWVGKKFPLDSFTDLPADLQNGKPTLVNFWFTTCGPCIREIPHLNTLQENLQHKANFLAITFNDEATVERFMNRFPFSWPQIYEAKGGIGHMSVRSYPTNMLLDKEGNVVFVFGSLDEQFVPELQDIFDLLQ
ncbi:MAG: TlpA disulfide reductase family protein [Weeksellaceae bacterium]|nr:TlpA disulfide reductase family protein [Weeksellaceae bacterium]